MRLVRAGAPWKREARALVGGLPEGRKQTLLQKLKEREALARFLGTPYDREKLDTLRKLLINTT